MPKWGRRVLIVAALRVRVVHLPLGDRWCHFSENVVILSIKPLYVVIAPTILLLIVIL